jgi:hypothetical protein
MRPKHFFAGLAITSIIQLICCFLLIWISDDLYVHRVFIAVSIIALAVFSILLYGAAKVYARSALARLYIQLIMLAVFLKMLLCLALIIGYKKGFQPADNSFIWPFLIIYLTSTIFEVIYMERVGREKAVGGGR